MADKELKVRLKTWTDTEANWKSKNPVLLKGEVGITSDNKRYKVGDGSSTWDELAYATLSWDMVTGKPSTFTPSSHTHAIADVTNLQATLNGKAPSTGSTSIKTLASTITLGTGDSATIDQNNGTYRQRIVITDNSTSGDEVFGFYQSVNSGSVYTDLFSIKDDSTVVAKTFSGSLSGNSTTMSYPLGFTSRAAAATWGNQDGTVVTDWHTSGGGDIAFRENGAQLNVVTDGFFYQNEGRYKCLDTNSYSSYALPLSGGTMNGTAVISWPDTGNWSKKNEGVTFPVVRGGLKWSGQSNGIELFAEETANDNLELILKFTDDNSNGLTIRNANGTATARITANGTFTGNASTATKATQDSAGQQINKTYIKGLSASGKTITYTKGDGSTGTISTQDTTYSNATTSASGLMSAADKTKLDGIATGATKVIVDTSLSSNSTNPVQNKVVNSALANKAAMVTLSYTENLNNVTTPGFYNCGGGNSITNKPANTDAIGLIVVHNASGNFYTQILTTSSNYNTYRRTCLNGSWSAWTQDVYTDTTYSAGTGITLSNGKFYNSGVRSVATGAANGTLTVNTNGTEASVAVKGLKSAAYTESTAYATSGHNHDSVYLKLVGGTMTGAISRSGGGSWISARNNAVVKGTATGASSFNVVASQKTPSGSWNIGNLGSNEYLAFSYDTDANYNAGTNKSTVTYLPTTGGTIPLKSEVVVKTGDTMSGDLLFSNSGTSTRQIRFTAGDNDYGRLAAGATATNAGWVELASADDGNEPIYVRQYTGVFSTIKRTATLLDGSGNTSFPGTVTAPIFSGPLNGNASSANQFKVYTSGNSSSDKTGYWYKVASCSITGQYGNCNLHFMISDTGHGDGTPAFFEGIARVKQQAALGSAPTCSVACKNRFRLALSNVKIVITTNTSSATNGELWVQIPTGYTVHKVTIVYSDGWTINTSMTLQQDLPSGTVITATDKATVYASTIAYADESNNNIKASYGSSLSVDGRTVKLLSKSGATLASITTQDTNTWRGVEDNLTSKSTSNSLTANQGRVLNEALSAHKNDKANPHGVTKAQVGLGNVANVAQITAISALGFYGMGRPDGNATDWIRTTSNGLIPYQSGAKGSGHSSLGTSSWYFSKAYIDNIFDSTGNNIKANYVNKIALSADQLKVTMGDGTSSQVTLGSIDKIISVTLSASKWTQDSTTSRWSQTVTNSAIKSTYNAICVSMANDAWSSDTLKAYNRAFAAVTSGSATTSNGSATFSTRKKPTTDITVGLYCTIATDSLASDTNIDKFGNLAYVNYTVVKTI